MRDFLTPEYSIDIHLICCCENKTAAVSLDFLARNLQTDTNVSLCAKDGTHSPNVYCNCSAINTYIFLSFLYLSS